MKVFVVAMESEAECAVSNMAVAEETREFGFRVVRGTMRGEDVAVVVSGVGKAAAAAATLFALGRFPGCGIVNFGLAGGLEPSMKVGDVYRIDRAVQYDFDLSGVIHKPVGTLDGRDGPYLPLSTAGGSRAFAFKTLGTGDRFNDSEADNTLLLGMGAGLRDMEGGAIAQICELAGVPCRMYKCVSDVYGSGSMPEQFARNIEVCKARLKAETPGF